MADSSPSPVLAVPSNNGSPLSALARLLGSSKGLVVALVIACTYAALFLRRVEWSQVQDFLTIIIPSWMGAQTAEEMAKQYAAGKVAAAKASPATVNNTTVVTAPTDGGA